MSTSATRESVAEVAGVEVSTDHFIGGERISSAERFEDLSPIDGRVLARVSAGGPKEAESAIAAARAAFGEWAGLGADGRLPYLLRLADLIDENVDRIAAVECEDMAMLLESLRARVIARGARNYRAYAELAAGYTERVWSSNGTENRVIRMPAGPAVVITPWNAPFMLSTWKTAPALAAGCTVVLKPAEWSPLSCSLLADLTIEAGLPPGVFNVVQGIGEDAGAALTAPPGASRISFTGSPETGRAIGRAAASNLVPFTGELGGKGPLMVFDDADLADAAAKAAQDVRRRRAGVPRGDEAARPSRGGRRVPRALPGRGRRAGAGRPSRPRDDDLATDPPRCTWLASRASSSAPARPATGSSSAAAARTWAGRPASGTSRP